MMNTQPSTERLRFDSLNALNGGFRNSASTSSSSRLEDINGVFRSSGRVLKEPRLSNDNWVNKINSAGRDSRSNEVVLLGLLPPFSENPSWVKKPETSATVSAIADSRIPGRVSKELKLFDDSQEFFWS
ncbi:hypothetical protein NC651_000425 [Populus alba x Populus x berolinensis]|nr:hypothetical protein NC651_000425 [Populus alba x Populus x berolinensis]